MSEKKMFIVINTEFCMTNIFYMAMFVTLNTVTTRSPCESDMCQELDVLITSWQSSLPTAIAMQKCEFHI